MDAEMDKLRDRMYEDMLYVGLIDKREVREEHTPESLWQIVMDYFKEKEVF